MTAILPRLAAAVLASAIALATFPPPAFAQEAIGLSAVSLSASGIGVLPIGSDARVFSFGYGGSLSSRLPMAFGGRLTMDPCLAFSFAPLIGVPGTGIASLELGASASFRIVELGPFGVTVVAGAGGFAATMKGTWAFNPSLSAGLRLDLSGKALAPTLGVSWRSLLGLSNELLIGGGLVFAIQPSHPAPQQPKAPGAKAVPLPLVGKEGKGGLGVASIDVAPIFPVYYKYYDAHPLGRIVLRNSGKVKIEGIEVEFLVKQFMANPKKAVGPDSLAPGSEATYELFGLFSDAILAVSEGTKVSGNIDISYLVRGAQATHAVTATLSVVDRNAIVWDDDRRAAAFVTAKDPIVLKFAKNLAGIVADAKRYNEPQGLIAALAVHEALRCYGMRYIVDPATSYASLSEKSGAIDFVQFPRQTLDFRAGDCDDLTVLFCALLESVGTGTAFITVPGHIFAAVDLGLSREEARRKFSRPDELIFVEERAWLPLEVTALGIDFLRAWETGAKEWRDANASGKAGFFPVHAAWTIFEPVSLSQEKADVSPPAIVAVSAAAKPLIERFIEAELAPQLAKIKADAAKEGQTPRIANRMGVAYASFGLWEKAEGYFRSAVAKEEYVPAIVNLGNLAFLRGDGFGARDYFARALRKAPNDARALLAAARAEHLIENYGSVKIYYDQLKKIDPRLAAQYAYLELRGEEAGRAADAGDVRGRVPWSE